MLDAQQQNEIAKRLRRIEGQVQGIQRMIGEARTCIDILQQLRAVTAALASVRVAIFRFHVRHCVSPASRGRLDHAQMVELVDMVDQLCK